ncbi:MAG: rhomboid family intramembrane serine protease [Acidobacteriota bacterium]|nr:rhomboid family intramembrane serine protease [Acidobacteriota bacterium]
MNRTILPFTVSMSTVVLSAAVWSSTTHRPLGSLESDMLGLAGTHLAAGQWHRLVTSVFLTQGGAVFWRSWAALTVFTGLAERRWGSWPAVGLFWGGHLWAVLVVTLGVATPLYHWGSEAGLLLFTASDVGPSAGYWSCLGAVVAGLPQNRRRLGGLLIGAALVVASLVGWSTLASAPERVLADATHLVAFASGFGLMVALGRRPIRQPGGEVTSVSPIRGAPVVPQPRSASPGRSGRRRPRRGRRDSEV